MLSELERFSGTWVALAAVVVLGLLWGSFANVCIYRMPPTDDHPSGRSVVRPGSHCLACKAPIRWYDNVPIVAWLWLRGRCRSCGKAFSARYLLVEALCGALFGFAWWMIVAGPPALAWYEPFDQRLVRFAIAAAFCFVMLVITFIDLDHKLILRKVTIPSLAVFYLLGWMLPERQWWDGLIGAAVGYGIPWAIGELYFRLKGREGLGLGDAELLAVVGALLGWKGVVVSLFGGSIVGSVIGIAFLLVARARARTSSAERGRGDAEERSLLRTELPFGPFLAIAAMFYLFAEPWLRFEFRLPGG